MQPGPHSEQYRISRAYRLTNSRQRERPNKNSPVRNPALRNRQPRTHNHRSPIRRATQILQPLTEPPVATYRRAPREARAGIRRPGREDRSLTRGAAGQETAGGETPGRADADAGAEDQDCAGGAGGETEEGGWGRWGCGG